MSSGRTISVDVTLVALNYYALLVTGAVLGLLLGGRRLGHALRQSERRCRHLLRGLRPRHAVFVFERDRLRRRGVESLSNAGVCPRPSRGNARLSRYGLVGQTVDEI